MDAIVRKNSSPVIGDGDATNLVVDCFGDLSVGSLVEKWKREGKLYFYNRGNTTTPVTFTNTAILYTRPSQVVRVPSGKTILPVMLGCHFETAAGVINEAVWISASNDVGAGTSTLVAAGTNRGNMRSDKAGDSGHCTVQITYSGDVTTTGANPVEFARWTQPFVDAIGAVPKHDWVLDIKTFSGMPLLVGPASLIFIAGGGTALTGYMTTIWAEFNSADLGL